MQFNYIFKLPSVSFCSHYFLNMSAMNDNRHTLHIYTPKGFKPHTKFYTEAARIHVHLKILHLRGIFKKYVMASLSILGFRPLPLSSSSELLPPSFYAVVCIILNVSVDLERFCRRLSNIWAKLNDSPHFNSIRWCHYEIYIAKRCRQKIPLTLPSKVQMKWHVRVTSQKTLIHELSDFRNHWITTKALLTVFDILQTKNKWCAQCVTMVIWMFIS